MQPMNMMPPQMPPMNMGPPPMSPIPPPVPQQEGGMNPILMLLIKMLMGGGEQMAPPQPDIPVAGSNFPAMDPTADPQSLAQRYLSGRNL